MPEANQYADQLLAGLAEADIRRRDPAFGELMDWLDGHPLSMRLILPHIQTTQPAALLADLRGSGSSASQGEDNWLSQLATCIAYSYAHLSVQARQLLPAVALLVGIADASLLSAFTDSPDAPERFSGASEQDWLRVLAEAAATGLLTSLIPVAGIYRSHPALPAFLKGKWREQSGIEVYRTEWDAAIRAMVASCADGSGWITGQIRAADAQKGFRIARLHLRTFGSMLTYALAHGMWTDAHRLFAALADFGEALGLTQEVRLWHDEVLQATEGSDSEPPEPGSPSARLWLDAIRYQLIRMRYEDAKAAGQRIINLLESRPLTLVRNNQLAAIYMTLGQAARRNGQLRDADRWASRALATASVIDDKPNVAAAYHQLGEVGVALQQLDRAAEFFRKALANHAGQEPRAETLTRLGSVAAQRGNLDEAENWYSQAFSITAALGLQKKVGILCAQFGHIAMIRNKFDESEDWLRRALAIGQEQNDHLIMGDCYHLLGALARMRGRLGEAEAWYRQALTLADEDGDKRRLRMTSEESCELAKAKGDLVGAMDWAIRSVTVFDEFPHPFTASGSADLVRLTSRLGFRVLATRWQVVTGSELPTSVRQYVRSKVSDNG